MWTWIQGENPEKLAAAGFYESRPFASLHSDLARAVQLFKSIETLLGETVDPCMFPLVKEKLCSEQQPGPSTAPQHVSAGHCFSLHAVFFSLQHIVISLRLLLRPLTVHFHSQRRTSMAVRSNFKDHPRTITFICCLIFSFPLSLLYGEKPHTHAHIKHYPNRRVIILTFIFQNRKIHRGNRDNQ